jgi:hypothetical protein
LLALLPQLSRLILNCVTLCYFSCRLTDVAVGEELLRRYVFIHLEHAADKLQLMLAMVHKLYALVRTAALLWLFAVVAVLMLPLVHKLYALVSLQHMYQLLWLDRA